MIVTAWDGPDGTFLAGLLASLAAIDGGALPPVRVLVPDRAAADRLAGLAGPRDLQPVVVAFERTGGSLSHDALLPRLPEIVESDGGPITWLAPTVWVQQPNAVDAMREGAADGALVAAFPIDRNYPSMKTDLSPWHVHRAAMTRAFGKKIAAGTWMRPAVDIGVFTLRGDAHHWDAWRQARDEAAQRGVSPGGGLFSLSALTLHLAMWHHKLPVTPLPARWNWLCHLAAPLWLDGRAVEPEPPHDPIAILHLSGPTPDRPMRIRDRAGRAYRSTLHFPPTLEPLGQRQP